MLFPFKAVLQNETIGTGEGDVLNTAAPRSLKMEFET